MDTILFGDYTVLDFLIYGGIGVGVLILIGILKKLFSGKKTSEHVQVVRCKNCGWQGQVSKYAGKCPKCSQPLGSQMAKKYRES